MLLPGKNKKTVTSLSSAEFVQGVLKVKRYYMILLTIKAPITTVADDIQNFFFYFSEKTSLDIPCESSAWQMIHKECQDLFSLKKKKKNAVCCSCDWRFNG